jgi:hypothetical protein
LREEAEERERRRKEGKSERQKKEDTENRGLQIQAVIKRAKCNIYLRCN